MFTVSQKLRSVDSELFWHQFNTVHFGGPFFFVKDGMEGDELRKNMKVSILVRDSKSFASWLTLILEKRSKKDLAAFDAHKKIIFLWACRCGHLALVKKHFEWFKVKQAWSNYGLLCAASEGQINLLPFFLDQGANIDCRAKQREVKYFKKAGSKIDSVPHSPPPTKIFSLGFKNITTG